MTPGLSRVGMMAALALAVGTLPATAQAPARASWMATAEDEATGIREVTASAKHVIPLTTKLRYQTLILLPEGEEVMDLLCGDKDLWVISASHNIVHVKPTTAGMVTNLNLVTATGTVYSFLLREGRADGKPILVPDLKVYVTAEATAPATPKWVPVAQFDAVQAELLEAKTSLDAERARVAELAAAAAATVKTHAPATLLCDYGPVPNTKPFMVQSICRTEDFTYIKTGARELPSLYEVKDGEPGILNFKVEDGLYVVPKVVEKGYLAIGDKKLAFALRGN